MPVNEGRVMMRELEKYKGDPNLNEGEEETTLVADTGKVFIRQCSDETYLLGVDRDPNPDKWCHSVITITELQRKKLIEFLSFGDA
jgi:hypothetical protein